MRHSAPREKPFPIKCFFMRIEFFIFRPKTMDYSLWFDFWSPKKVLIKVYHLKGNEKRNLMALVSVA